MARSASRERQPIGWCSTCSMQFHSTRAFSVHASHRSTRIKCAQAHLVLFGDHMTSRADGAEQYAAASEQQEAMQNAKRLEEFGHHLNRQAGRAEATSFLLRSRCVRKYFKNVPVHHLELEREDVMQLMQLVQKQLKDELKPGMTQAEMHSCIARTCNVFQGIETTHLEHRALINDLSLHGLQPVEPVRRKLQNPSGESTNDICYDIPIDQSLEYLLLSRPEVWRQVCCSHQSWMDTASSRLHKAVTEYNDLTDGEVVRSHPTLGDVAACVARDESDDTLRLKLILYYDEVETTNAIGAFTGVHKIGLFYYALVDIPPEQRMALHNIQLATVVLYDDFSKYGPDQIISGPPGESRGVGSCIGAAMERLHDGLWICLPKADVGRNSSADSSYSSKAWNENDRTLLKAWIICLSADYPAAAACCGFKASTAAHCFCRQCMINKTVTSSYPKPFSFLRLGVPFKLRSMKLHREQHEAYIQNPSPAMLTDTGVNSFTSPMHRVPLFDHLIMAPQDIMHVLPEGVLKLEIAALLFMLCRKRKWGVTLAKVNQACSDYPWPTGHKPPNFRDAILEGRAATDGPSRPKKGCHVHGSAGQVLDFTLHSLEILRKFIKDEDDPVWTCWKLLVQILMIVMHHVISQDMIWRLDDLIQEHHRVFLSIPEYVDLFKPKHHFCAHVPLDIIRFGPPRHYWCMRFEAANQIFKHIAMGGNYTETCKRCAKFHVMRTALSCRFNLQQEWGNTMIISKGAVETSECKPQLVVHGEGDAHKKLVCRFYELLNVPAESGLRIQWVRKLAHSGRAFAVGHDWIYFQPFEGAQPNPWTLVLIGNIACINDDHYMILHMYPYKNVKLSGKECIPKMHIDRGTQPKIAVYPIHMICMLPVWLVPDVGKDMYRLVPRLFG